MNYGQRHVTLAMVCNSGRHRSVAVAILVQQCLIAFGMFNVKIIHVSQKDGGWKGTCGGANGFEVEEWSCIQCSWSRAHTTVSHFISSIWTAI